MSSPGNPVDARMAEPAHEIGPSDRPTSNRSATPGPGGESQRLPGTTSPALSARGYRFGLLLVCLLTAALLTTWAVVTPAFRAPDEPQHANSVLRLLSGGGWPAPAEARVLSGIQSAMTEAAFSAELPGSAGVFDWGPDEFVEATPPSDESRLVLDHADPALTVESATAIDQMTQHPPLYYAVVAAALRLVGLDDTRWDIQLLAMRMVSVLLTVLAVPFIASAVRLLTGSRPLALAGACVPLVIPQFQHISGSVTNDALLTLTGAATASFIVAIVGGDLRLRTAALAGAALGAGLLTKAFLLLAAPFLLGAFVVARAPGYGFASRLGRAALCGAVAMAIGGWWWVRNVVLYGAVQPPGMTRIPNYDPGRTLEIFLPTAAGALSQSFWAKFGWLEINIASPFASLSTALGLALITLGVVTSGRRWRDAIVLAGFAASVPLVVVYNGLKAYRESGIFPGLQGRYFYVVLGALTALAALGVWFLLRRSERAASALLPVVGLAGLAVSALGLWIAFQGFYRASGESPWAAVARWLAWSPAKSTHAVVLLGVLLLTALAFLSWTVIHALRARSRAAVTSRP
jgi:hypothetical protein